MEIEPIELMRPCLDAIANMRVNSQLEESQRMQVKPTFCNEEDVIEKLENLGRGLQQAYQCGSQLGVALFPQVPHNLEGSSRVQARRYVILRSIFH